MQIALVSSVAAHPLLSIAGLLLVLFAGLSWLNRRAQGAGLNLRRSGSLRRESVALTGQHALHMVELAGERWLVGTGPGGGPRLIARLGRAEHAEADPADPAEAAKPWAELAGRLREGLGG